jgi:hypothetical protein
VLEVLIVAGVIVAVVLVAAVPWPTLLVTGLVTTAVGLVVGVTTGFWYHVALGRAILASGTLPPRWWWHPVSLHDRLQPADRRGVMPWFYVGAAGFFLTVVGIALTAISMGIAMLRSP